MASVQLIGGAYTAKSLIAGAQRVVNLYGEKNQKGAPFPVTYYERPGNKLAITGPGSAGRCQYRASNGELFEVVSGEVYYTDPTPARHVLGTIIGGPGPVSMSDNGQVVLLVDGTGAGYVINLGTHTFTLIVDAAFYGSTRVEYMDTFFVLNRPGTTQFYLSPPNWDGVTPFDPLDIADKVGGADPLQVAAVNAGNIQLIGTLTTEIWYNAQGADFPFARVPSVFIEHGTPAPYSVAQNDVGTYLLSQDDDGGCIVGKIVGYEFRRITTHSVEATLAGYSTVADCVAMTFQMDGHAFVRFQFPTANATWLWDESQELWTEETWTDDNGAENRHRAQCTAYAYAKNWMLDWQNGNLYQADFATLLDEGAVSHPIVCRRGFPHLVKELVRLEYSKFIANMQAAPVAGLLAPVQPPVSLRWSDTRGYTWEDPRIDGVGSTGDYGHLVTFWQLGMAQDRVFELFWDKCGTALGGAFIDYDASET